jgi:O-antigen/teichoic acid export membrane protein
MTNSRVLQASFVIGERALFLISSATTIILITRLMGNEFFGRYALVLTWSAVVQLVANFGISECLARDLGREPQLSSRYFTHSLAFGAVFSAIVIPLIAVAVTIANYPRDIEIAILVTTAILLPTNIMATCRGILLAHRRVQYMLVIAAVETLVLLPLNIYWILTRAGLLELSGTILAAKLVAGVVSVWLVHRFIAPLSWPVERTTFVRLWKTLLPFGIASIIVFPSIRLDVLLLSKIAQVETVGLYVAASKVMEILFVFPLAFFMIMLPRTALELSELGEERTSGLKTSLAWYFAFVIPIGAAGIAFARPLVHLLFGESFSGAIIFLQINMVTYLLLTLDVALAMICKAAGFQRNDLNFVVTTFVLNLLLNLLLIPRLIGIGASIAVLLAILAGVVLRLRFVTTSIARLSWTSFIVPPAVSSLGLAAGCSVLMVWVPWPILATAFALVYTAIALSSFTLLRNPLSSLIERRRTGM